MADDPISLVKNSGLGYEAEPGVVFLGVQFHNDSGMKPLLDTTAIADTHCLRIVPLQKRKGRSGVA